MRFLYDVDPEWHDNIFVLQISTETKRPLFSARSHYSLLITWCNTFKFRSRWRVTWLIKLNECARAMGKLYVPSFLIERKMFHCNDNRTCTEFVSVNQARNFEYLIVYVKIQRIVNVIHQTFKNTAMNYFCEGTSQYIWRCLYSVPNNEII